MIWRALRTLEAEEKAQYLSELYAVRFFYVEQITKFFNVFPDRDCFASFENRRFEKFWDEGLDAFAMSWGPAETLWMNPPWSLWPHVVDKLEKSDCTVITIVPAWSKHWIQRLRALSTSFMYFEKGTNFFELHGRPCAGIKWGVWALLIERSHKRPEGWWKSRLGPMSEPQKRRWRRWRAEEARKR